MALVLSPRIYNYAILDAINSQKQPSTNPRQTALQNLNTKIQSTNDPYLYGIMEHLLQFHKCVSEMLQENVAEMFKDIPEHYKYIQIKVTIDQVTIQLVEGYFILSAALLTLSSIEIFINLLIHNLINSIKNKKTAATGENAKRFRQIKFQLIEMSKFVDKILMHYKDNIHTHDSSLPDISDVEKVKEEVFKLLSKITRSKIHKLFAGYSTCVTYHEFIVSVIGLKCEIGKQVAHAQQKFPEHQPDLYYLKRFMKENIEDNLNPSSSSPSLSQSECYATVLEESGFTNSKASTLGSLICENDPEQHQSLTYWIDAYLEYAFKYDIFLNDNCPRFPFTEKKLDKWIKYSTKIRDRVDGKLELIEFDVHYINLNEQGVKSITKKSDRFPLSEKSSKYWYHGTDHKAAEHILKHGILLSEGRERQDFSQKNGFYLSQDYSYACKWANKRGSTIIKGAVLVFEYECLTCDKFTGTNFFSDFDEWTPWEECVRFFRSGKTDHPDSIELESRLIVSDYLFGPRSGDNTENSRSCEWKPTISEGNIPQLCIRSEKMAKKLSLNLKGVMFFAP